MRGVIVSSRYAKSLLGLAVEQKLLEETYADMKKISEVCKQNRDFVVLLKSPIVKSDKKIKIINLIFEGKLNKITEGFIAIITNHRREGYLIEIADSFIAQYKNHKNIATAEIVSAYALDDSQRKKIKDAIFKVVGKEIELSEKVNADLIGGLIVRVGDKQFDGSIARKLKELKKGFSKNAYISQL